MDNEKQGQRPNSNPDDKNQQANKVRFDEPMENRERLWKHESEIPDASNKPAGTGSGQGQERN